MALWHASFSRDGPGLLLRDLQRGDETLAAMARNLRDADADIIVLTKFDYDVTGAAIGAFSRLIDDGHSYAIPLRSNTGIPTGHDLDLDGRFGEPEDAQDYGRFPGEGALAVLSKFPIDLNTLRSFNTVLWSDIQGTHLLSTEPGFEVQRLSSGGHWIVPISISEKDAMPTRISILVGHAGPPVFDGPEDRNGRRNLDELRLWEQIIDGQHGGQPAAPTVFMANTNLDPERGDGFRGAMAQFLARPGFQDMMPGKPTAHWETPGPMRVSYLLPSSDLVVRDSKVWPVMNGQKHSLITVDISLPNAPLP